MRTSATRHTARFTATNDETGNQIASFYPGAMSEDGEIDIISLANANAVDLVVIGAGDPAAMQRFTADCRAAGLTFAADFSQQVAFLDGDSMRTLIEGAAYLFCNEYEEAVIEQKTGWSSEDILDRVETRIITLGADGARVERKGAEPVVVGPVAGRDARRADRRRRRVPLRLPRRHGVGPADGARDPAWQPDGGARP